MGFHVIKDAVRFYDPELSRPQMIPVTEELKRSVRQAHSAYRDHLEKEKRRKGKEKEKRLERRKNRLKEFREKNKSLCSRKKLLLNLRKNSMKRR